MKTKISKVTLLILILALLLTTMLVPMSAFAASGTGYDSANDVEYVKSGNYIYNWGYRGETATFLSPNAQKFYTGSYTFASLSQASGGTSQSNAPSSALYNQLKALMTSKQTYVTSYDATRGLYQYTDCQLSGKESNKISSFYSGDPIGPAWDGGSTWNREHTWPNSKGDASGQGENDIMMLRPTAKSENGSRGNKAYGKSSGYYNPNSESGGKYDLRGDVARICLYVYTRWGNTGSMWGSSGVMESLSVLLEWMEADPVDTWEMGRNDSVESITGTRNVFVDYPEYAWLLFGQSVPANYATPSGSNGVTPPNPEDCEHTFNPATCTEPKTCTKCWTTEGSALGHTTPDANGLCTRCNEVLEVKTTHAGTQADPYTVADALKVGAALNGGSGTSIIYVKGVVTTVGTVKNNTYRQGIVVKDSSTNQTLNISTANPNPSTDLEIAVGDTLLLWGYLRTNSSSGNPEMGSVNGTYVYYSIVEGEQGGNQGGDHTHEFGEATCTTPATCSCGATEGSALGHTTTNGTCTRCGATIGSGSQGGTQEQSTSIDLTSASNKVSASGSKLEFATGSLKVTVDKASSSNDLVDKTGEGYSARVYQGATLTVEYSQMTKIVITCDSYEYSGKSYYSGFDGMTVAGATITRDGLVITITFDQPTDKFVSAGLASQTRIMSIEVFSGTNSGNQGGDHTHEFGEATCTSPATCACGETQGNALGHTTTNGTCTRCGATIGSGSQGGNGGQIQEQSQSIDLTSVTNKVSASTQKLEFATGSLKVTVDKASSTVDLVDKTGDGYAARVYAGATLTVEFSQMTKIVINCDGGTYNGKTYFSGFEGMSVAGATITCEGSTITITFANATDKFVSAGLASQTRILSIDVFTSSQGGTTHTHSFGNATCTSPATCACGETQGNALGHTTTNGTCTRCGQTIGSGNQGGSDTPDATVEAFKLAVTNIANATKLDDKFEAISTAVSIYNTMDANQKAQATTEIETLKSHISSYNQIVEQENATANIALKFAVQIAGMVTLVAAAFVLNKKVF